MEWVYPRPGPGRVERIHVLTRSREKPLYKKFTALPWLGQFTGIFQQFTEFKRFEDRQQEVVCWKKV